MSPYHFVGGRLGTLHFGRPIPFKMVGLVGPGPPLNQILWFFFAVGALHLKRPVYTPNITLYENKIICQCQAPPFCRRFGIPFCRWVRGVDKYIHKCKYIWTQKILTDHVDFVVEMIAKFSKPPKFWNQPRSRKKSDDHYFGPVYLTTSVGRYFMKPDCQMHKMQKFEICKDCLRDFKKTFHSE